MFVTVATRIVRFVHDHDGVIGARNARMVSCGVTSHSLMGILGCNVL